MYYNSICFGLFCNLILFLVKKKNGKASGPYSIQAELILARNFCSMKYSTFTATKSTSNFAHKMFIK